MVRWRCNFCMEEDCACPTAVVEFTSGADGKLHIDLTDPELLGKRIRFTSVDGKLIHEVSACRKYERVRPAR